MPEVSERLRVAMGHVENAIRLTAELAETTKDAYGFLDRAMELLRFITDPENLVIVSIHPSTGYTEESFFGEVDRLAADIAAAATR